MASSKEIVEAATEVSTLLKNAGIAHAIIGGAACVLLGLPRNTNDVDILIEPLVSQHHKTICRKSSRFTISNNSKIVYRSSESGVLVPIETLEGGPGSFIRLPAVDSVPILTINQVHPSTLLCMKLSRWSWMSESTRAQSQAKAESDRHDIMFLLEWLAESQEKITFQGFEESSRERLLEGLRKLESKYERAEELLKIVLDEAPVGSNTTVEPP
ncbi:hypothetical protein TWF481_007098 [Arthrobotrys musiformis]|uniref:Uncharacterized protein n=1 Tax=Arthrobotrys musiformis TaxID=47236 RepID=A0AAV9WBA5_9PEZI